MTLIEGRGGVPVLGIAGWKNSGKTTLTVRLVTDLTRRGYRVATVKHAHHDLRIDDAETDSARHRRAGAAQVAVVSNARWALVTELKGAAEPSLAEIIGSLEPCDLIIVEGYKSAPIPKIEARRRDGARHEDLATVDPHVIAIAADHSTEAHGRPLFALDDIDGLVDLIVTRFQLGAPGSRRDSSTRAAHDRS